MINVTGSDDVSGKDGEDILVPPTIWLLGSTARAKKSRHLHAAPSGPADLP
jgi:hypothetical protein